MHFVIMEGKGGGEGKEGEEESRNVPRSLVPTTEKTALNFYIHPLQVPAFLPQALRLEMRISSPQSFPPLSLLPALPIPHLFNIYFSCRFSFKSW